MSVTRKPTDSSLERMLAILDIFTEERPMWTADEIAEQFGYTRSTAYRYVKELVHAGLLTQAEVARYALGPRIIQLDRQLRLTDPMIRAMGEVPHRLPVWADQQIWLLCRLFRDRVVCIHEHGELSIGITYSRGLPMSLFRGATSKVNLAHLPENQQMRLYLENMETANEAGLGADWPAFKDALRGIRRRGFAMSVGEVRSGVFGMAAPVFGAGGRIAGSLSLIRDARALDPSRCDDEGAVLRTLADEISASMNALTERVPAR